ncbi:ABC transporter permease [Halomarina salina]|uniref:ABC transporter permease n=1 Tax=Halomarina salina TaxID=1872699 RepID=A0ABD5RQ99_9EURY|nr:ABC transporter permease [Halomarina salina]
MVSPRTIRNLKREWRSNWLAKIGVFLVVTVLLVAVFAPFVAPDNPRTQNLDDGNLPPIGFSETKNTTSSEFVNGSVKVVSEQQTINATWDHPMGTNELGQDMFSRVVYGARTSLIVGIFGTLLAMLIGVPVGLVAGYYRGYVDDALMRFADVMLAFPSLVLAVALVGLWGRLTRRVYDPFVAAGLAPGMPETITIPVTVIVVVALVTWVWFARVARGEAISVREEEYVKAARSLGASDSFVIRKHILPNSVTPILVLGAIQIAAIILLESALSFLGFSGTQLSWGFDISQGRDSLATSWWVATMPGIAIVLTVIGINLVGDWLRDALDPGLGGEGGSGA